MKLPACSSFGSLGDIIAEMLATQAGIQMALLNLGSAVNFVKDGKAKAIAVTSAKRHPGFPDWPTAIEGASGLEGGYFDPPIDLAREAEAAGAYGENVRDPGDVLPALRRGLERVRSGIPAVIAAWLPRLLKED